MKKYLTVFFILFYFCSFSQTSINKVNHNGHLFCKKSVLISSVPKFNAKIFIQYTTCSAYFKPTHFYITFNNSTKNVTTTN